MLVFETFRLKIVLKDHRVSGRVPLAPVLQRIAASEDISLCRKKQLFSIHSAVNRRVNDSVQTS